MEHRIGSQKERKGSHNPRTSGISRTGETGKIALQAIKTAGTSRNDMPLPKSPDPNTVLKKIRKPL